MKGSQHNPENAIDMEETLKGGCPQNVDPRFVTMADVAAMLERERAKMPYERLFSRRPPYPIRLLNKPYRDRYEPLNFSQYDGKKGSDVEHVSKFLDTTGPYAGHEDLCLREFSKSLCDCAYTWYANLRPGSVPTSDDMVDFFCSKYFH